MKPERKTALTFAEKITAAHLHYVQGIDQHVIAFAMGVNQGRINEACVDIRKALLPKPGHTPTDIQKGDAGGPATGTVMPEKPLPGARP